MITSALCRTSRLFVGVFRRIVCLWSQLSTVRWGVEQFGCRGAPARVMVLKRRGSGFTSVGLSGSHDENYSKVTGRTLSQV